MLMEDPVLGGGMRLVVINQLSQREHARLRGYEEELVTLTEVVSANAVARAGVSWFRRPPTVSQHLTPRTQHLAEAIAESNRVLEDLVQQRHAIEASLEQRSAASVDDAAVLSSITGIDGIGGSDGNANANGGAGGSTAASLCTLL